MLTSRLLTAFAASGLLASASCSDTTAPKVPRTLTPATPNAPRTPTPATPLMPQLITITGSVHLTGMQLNEVVLNTGDGLEIPLAGASTALLARVDEAGVEVRGSWNADSAFDVADFVVQIVGGAPVLDGVLIAIYDTKACTEESSVLGNERSVLGYALRLTRGDTVELKEPSAELLAHVGERIWVAGPIDGPPTAFGIIGGHLFPNGERHSRRLASSQSKRVATSRCSWTCLSRATVLSRFVIAGRGVRGPRLPSNDANAQRTQARTLGCFNLLNSDVGLADGSALCHVCPRLSSPNVYAASLSAVAQLEDGRKTARISSLDAVPEADVVEGLLENA